MKYDNQTDGVLQDTEPEQDTAATLGGMAKREIECPLRIKVSFTGSRVKLLDPDNFAGSCKDLLDGLRHAGFIPDDAASAIIFETAQERVRKYKDEKTEIEIVYP